MFELRSKEIKLGLPPLNCRGLISNYRLVYPLVPKKSYLQMGMKNLSQVRETFFIKNIIFVILTLVMLNIFIFYTGSQFLSC